MLASNSAPGLLSPQFGFQRWPDFDTSSWKELIEEAEQIQSTLPANLIFGSDRDQRAVELARRNAEHAGIGAQIRWSYSDFAKL